MKRDREWHHCTSPVEFVGGIDIVTDGHGWRMEDAQFHYGETFQHGATIDIAFCPFCGVRLGTERLTGPDGQTYTVIGKWHGGRIEDKP